MNAPRVSVLVPVYNREKLLGPCIESALVQTFADIEVIVVDNASTDGTWSVCENYANRDERVRIYRNEVNLGPVGNWRHCLSKARAPLAKLLFSDDLLSPEYLSRTVPVLDDAEIGFVFTAARFIDAEGQPTGQVRYAFPEWPLRMESSRYLRAGIIAQTMPLSPGAALFRTADLHHNLLDHLDAPLADRFLETGAGIDLLCYLLTAAQYSAIAHLEAPLVDFREHAGSISISRTTQVRAQYLEARIWFCRRHALNLLGKVLAESWWLHRLSRGQWQTFARFREIYGIPEKDARMPPIAWRMAWRYWLRRLRGNRPLTS